MVAEHLSVFARVGRSLLRGKHVRPMLGFAGRYLEVWGIHLEMHRDIGRNWFETGVNSPNRRSGGLL